MKRAGGATRRPHTEREQLERIPIGGEPSSHVGDRDRMQIDEFARYSEVLHRLTVDFVWDVPNDKWEFTPDSPSQTRQPPRAHRLGVGMAPFAKQVRHLVCVRGVYNAALAEGRVDWRRKHEHYRGPLARDALLAALDQQQQRLRAILETLDTTRSIDWDGTPFTFAMFTWEYVQHEAIHHGQWSVYASVAGFETPLSWRSSWGL